MNGTSDSGTQRTVLLGTGGTIAGAGDAKPGSGMEYVAGTLPVDKIAHGVAVPDGHRLDFEQIAQIDSKDRDFAVWHQFAIRCAALVASPDVAAVIITHGTDTIEETAFFLHSVLGLDSEPVVLARAMRPTTAISADGPQNLQDAIAVATAPGSMGVLVVCAGKVRDEYITEKQPDGRSDYTDIFCDCAAWSPAAHHYV